MTGLLQNISLLFVRVRMAGIQDELMRSFLGRSRSVAPKLLAGACITGPILGLTLYAVLRVFGGWRYTPLVFASVFLLGIGLFSTWAWYSSGE